MNTKEKLKMMCHERGMEFKDLAEKMGVSRASLSQMINREVVTVKTLRKIAAALGLTYEGLTVQLGNQIFSDSIKRQNKPEETCRDVKEVLDKCRVSITPFPFHIVEEYARKNNFTLLKDNGITLFSYLHVESERFCFNFPVEFLAAVELLREKKLPGARMFLYLRNNNKEHAVPIYQQDTHVSNDKQKCILMLGQKDTYISTELDEIYVIADYLKEQLKEIETETNADK